MDALGVEAPAQAPGGRGSGGGWRLQGVDINYGDPKDDTLPIDRHLGCFNPKDGVQKMVSKGQ